MHDNGSLTRGDRVVLKGDIGISILSTYWGAQWYVSTQQYPHIVLMDFFPEGFPPFLAVPWGRVGHDNGPEIVLPMRTALNFRGSVHNLVYG